MTHINIEKFMSLFSTEERYGYKDIKKYNNEDGFSIQREYPKNILFKPSHTKDGYPDDVAVIHIIFNQERRTKEIKGNYYNLTIKIGSFSRYLNHHFEYDYNDEDCPTEASIKYSKSTIQPIEITSRYEYLYNLDSNTLINEKGEITTGQEVLNRFYNTHCRTATRMGGLITRLKIKIVHIAILLCDFLISLCKIVLKYMCGRIYDPEDPYRGILSNYSKNDIVFITDNHIEIHGYKTSKNIFISFSFIVLIVYSVLFIFNIENNITLYLTTILTKPILPICGSILLLIFLDRILPQIILFIVNIIISLKSKLVYRRFHIRLVDNPH